MDTELFARVCWNPRTERSEDVNNIVPVCVGGISTYWATLEELSSSLYSKAGSALSPLSPPLAITTVIPSFLRIACILGQRWAREVGEQPCLELSDVKQTIIMHNNSICGFSLLISIQIDEHLAHLTLVSSRSYNNT